MAIVNGWKTVENRSWRPARPLRLLIHADVTFDRHGAAFIASLGIELPQASVRGAIIGTVLAAAFTTDSLSRWAVPGMWHWQLTEPVPATCPLPCRGHRRLFTPPSRWRDHFPPL
jgi:hypothetical protein